MQYVWDEVVERGLVRETRGAKYLIWSNEHRGWWGADRRGYPCDIDYAGRYSLEEALRICNGANYGWNESRNPEELPMLKSVALQLSNKLYRKRNNTEDGQS